MKLMKLLTKHYLFHDTMPKTIYNIYPDLNIKNCPLHRDNKIFEMSKT